MEKVVIDEDEENSDVDLAQRGSLDDQDYKSVLKLSEKTQRGVGCFDVEKLVMEED